MKHTVLRLMQAAGAFAPFRLANRNKALIVTYHRFSRGETPLATAAHAFSEQLDYLTEHYNVVPLSVIAGHLERQTELPPGLAAITIDDGYRDFYDIAFPLLRQRGLPATLFVVTDFIDGDTWLWTDKLRYLTRQTQSRIFEASIEGHPLTPKVGALPSRLEAAARINSILKSLPDETKESAIDRIAASLRVELPQATPDEFAPMTWDQIKEIDSAGIEIGSHTLTHPLLIRVDEARLRRELEGSKKRLESVLGHHIDLFCYPNGDCNAAIRQAVELAGYRCAVTTEPGLNGAGSDPLTLKRLPTEDDLARFAQSTSGFELIRYQLRGKKALAAGGGD